MLRRVEELAAGPVLLVVDDAQWIDASSLSVLAFVANRIAGSSVAMVVAARGEVAPPGFAAHPVVPLPQLDSLQSRLVLRRTGHELDDSLVAAIIRASAGNPLALVELARAAASGSHTPTDPMLPLPERLERAFAAELPDLPTATQDLLVLAAAGADELSMLSAVSGASRRAGRAGARRAHAACCGSGTRASTGGTRWPGRRRTPRRRATSAAAPTAPWPTLPTQAPDRRAWHLSRAALGPDEDVAAELEAAAVRAQEWGGYAEACRAMQRSAEFTPEPEARSRRLAATAQLAAQSGQFDRLQEFGIQIHHLTEDPQLHLQVDHAIAYALGHTTRQHSARVALLEVIEQGWLLDTPASWSTLTSLAAVALRTGEGNDAVREWQHRLESVGPTGAPTVQRRAGRRPRLGSGRGWRAGRPDAGARGAGAAPAHAGCRRPSRPRVRDRDAPGLGGLAGRRARSGPRSA